MFLLVSCKTKFDHPDKQIFHYNESSGILSLDPAFASGQAAIWPCNQLYNGLVDMDSVLQVVPAIALSALLFALIHSNPVQMPHAFLVGLLLGWMYYRTDSIVPGVAYHWVNNTIAYIVYNFYPDPSLKLIDLFGGNERSVMLALLFSLLIFLPALYQLNLRLKKAGSG